MSAALNKISRFRRHEVEDTSCDDCNVVVAGTHAAGMGYLNIIVAYHLSAELDNKDL